MCTPRLTIEEQENYYLWRSICTEGMWHHIKGHMPITWINSSDPSISIGPLSLKCSPISLYIAWKYELQITQWLSSCHLHLHVHIMDASQYWPFACEYSIWNAAVAALQFWMADLEPHVLSHAINWVYAAFFYRDHTQQLQNLPEEVFFSWFVTTLNDVFKVELTQ